MLWQSDFDDKVNVPLKMDNIQYFYTKTTNVRCFVYIYMTTNLWLLFFPFSTINTDA